MAGLAARRAKETWGGSGREKCSKGYRMGQASRRITGLAVHLGTVALPQHTSSQAHARFVASLAQALFPGLRPQRNPPNEGLDEDYRQGVGDAGCQTRFSGWALASEILASR